MKRLVCLLGKGSFIWIARNCSGCLKEVTVNRKQALKILSTCKPILQERYKLKSLALFGSTARDYASEKGDIDILVDFDDLNTAGQFFGVQFYLEDMLSSSVDLVTQNALKKELDPYVNKDCIHV